MAAKEKGERDVPALNDGLAASADYAALDDLAIGLASGTLTRRQALRMLGTALVGGALAAIPKVAWAAKGDNSAYAKFCKENFPPGRERGQCISAGARGEGPCFDNGGGGGGGCTTEGASCFDEFGETGICCCGRDPNTGETTNCICCARFGSEVCGIDVATGEALCPGTY